MVTTMNPALAPTELVFQMPRPLARLKQGMTAKEWPLMDTTSYRPGYNLKPDRVWAAYRHAETGYPAMQCDMLEDVRENDGHLAGQWNSRNQSVSFREWSIRPGGKAAIDIEAASELQYALRRANMLELHSHLMEGIYYGWSAANTAWGIREAKNSVDDLAVPIWFLPAVHRRFLVERYTDVLMWRSEDNPYPGDYLEPGQWIVARRPGRKVARAGIGRTTTWWALFKRMAITDWIVFAEKFGLPFTLGYYGERASEESRRALEQALTDIGSDGQAVLSETTRIALETPMRQGDVAHLHPAIADRCDAEISKVVTGATLNVSHGGAGSFALGRVHENRAISLQFADAYWLQDMFDRQLCQPFVQYNPRFAKAESPRLTIRVQPEMDPQTLATVLAMLQGMGLAIDAEEMYERFGLRRPDAGDALKPINVEPPKPSKEPAQPSKDVGKPGKPVEPAKPPK